MEYILERFEHSLLESREQCNDLYSLIENPETGKPRWTIEHIMPRNAKNAQWPVLLDYDDPEGMRDRYVNKLGNLTFTAYNRDLSRFSFCDKCNLQPGGYNVSGIKMNQEIAKESKWGPDEIDTRTKKMAKDAAKIWKYPQVDFTSADTDVESFETLDGDKDNFAGLRLRRFNLKLPTGKIHEESHSSWANMYRSVILALHRTDSSALERVAQHSGQYGELEKWVYADVKDVKSPFRINDGVYIQQTPVIAVKITVLRLFFDLYNLDYTNLRFYLDSNHKTAVASKRREDIFNIVKKWAQNRAITPEDICFNPDHSSKPNSDDSFSYVRFTTPYMTTIFPDQIEDSLWGNKHHYFYGIVNSNENEIFIQLSLNTTGASHEFINSCKRVDLIADESKKKTRVKKWYAPIKDTKYTSKICLCDNITEQVIFDGLDECMEKIQEFEEKVKREF